MLRGCVCGGGSGRLKSCYCLTRTCVLVLFSLRLVWCLFLNNILLAVVAGTYAEKRGGGAVRRGRGMKGNEFL